MSNFLILGLPRSRTFWLSQLLTGDGVECYHDLTAHRATVAEVAETLTKPHTAKVVGNSDSAQILVLDRLLPRLPLDTRILFIRRPWQDAARSFLTAAGVEGESGGWEKAFKDLDAKLNHWQLHLYPHCMMQEFEDLDDGWVIRKSWEYLTDGLPFPTERWHSLRDQRLTITNESIREAIKKPWPSSLTEHHGR